MNKDTINKTIIIVLIVASLGGLVFYLYKKSKKPVLNPSKVLKDVFQQLQFEFNKSIINPISYPSLDELINTLKEESAKNWKLKVEGHTDDIGDDAYNMTLSQSRANAVKEYIVSKGISVDRITSIGYGETKPIGDNKTKEGQLKNRRVEFIIEKPNGEIIKS